jgi:DNA-binding NarL/FixJ family response regulator
MLPARIRVVIADDHPVILEGLRSTLGANQQITVVGMAPSYSDLLDILKLTIADIAILDLQGMQVSPFTMVDHLRRAYPNMAIIVFSSLIDLAPELFEAGVQAYITKIEMTSHLFTAIEMVMKGMRFASPVVAQYVAREQGAPQFRHLAPGERKVLKLLASGYDTLEIAEQLSIDPRSVQNYITSLRRKTGFTQRTRLMDWYRRLFFNEDGIAP